MNVYPGIAELGHWQGQIIRRMMLLSVVAHAAVIALGPAASSLFPARVEPAPVFVELASLPMSELPEEMPAPPLPVASAEASPRASVSAPSVSKPTLAARRWLDRVDAGAANLPEAPVARKEAKPGGIPVRQWANGGLARPHDFAPAVAPERAAAMGKHLEDLESRVRQSGRPSVGLGRETEASMMFGGNGDAAGEPIPAWVRDLIRKRVRNYLPELEGVYTDAIRRNPDLRGKLLVRFRIQPSGNILDAESVDGSIQDAVFVKAILEKVRHWKFESTAGRTVEVLYPLVFVAPS